MHFKKHKLCCRQFFFKTLVNSMVAMSKKSRDWFVVSPGVYFFLEFISHHFSLGENLWFVFDNSLILDKVMQLCRGKKLQPFPSLYSHFLHFFIYQPSIDSLPSSSMSSPFQSTLPSSTSLHCPVVTFRVAKPFLKKSVQKFVHFQKKSVQSVHFSKKNPYNPYNFRKKFLQSVWYSKLGLLRHILNWVCKTIF